MSVISRRFAACPARTASETWTAIVNVIAADSDTLKTQLMEITGIVASIISEETLANNAITLIGSGPRLRVYCLYNEDAIADDPNEAALSWKPFENEWEMFFPVEENDHEWVSKLLKEKNARFKTYKAGEKITADEDERASKSESNFNQLTINLDKLK